MKKKILFIFRYDALKDILRPDGTTSGPTEFLWGMNFVDKDRFDMKHVNAPRLEKRIGIRRFFWLFEFPFGKMTKIGFPLEIPYLYPAEVTWADEIVCVNDQISAAMLFWKMVGKLKGKKVHCIIMSFSERIKYFRWNRPMVWFVGKLLRCADTILTLSKAVEEDFVRDFHLRKEKMHTLYFGPDTSFWYPESVPEESFILSVGNDMNRDYSTLIDALEADIKLILVTKKKVDTKGKNVEFLSDISNEELRTLYNRAALVVVPSIVLKNESSGLSCMLQSMATRRSVIVSYAPPLAEMFVDGRDCLFYQPEDVSDLRVKINMLLTDEDMRRQIAAHGYETATQKYSATAMGKVWDSIL